MTLLVVNGILGAIALGFFATMPVQTGRVLCTGTTVFFCAGGWLTFCAGLIYLGRWSKLPTFALLIAWGFLASYCNDNHQIVAVSGAAIRKDRPTLKEDFTKWNEYWRPTTPDSTHPPDPSSSVVFLVTAEGGGIRAAYWTAAVLGRIAEKNPMFARHVYAISSVSGGTLGAAVFIELLRKKGCTEPKVGDLEEPAAKILLEDYLSPLAGRLLLTDLFQRVVPHPFEHFDRGRALEEAWAAPWQKGNENPLTERFAALWPGCLPRLFANATHAETGKRAILSYPLIAPAVLDSEDLLDLGLDPSMAEAIHLSARFPYASPPATVMRRGKPQFHLVDGGYFENSGAATAHEVASEIKTAAPSGAPPRVVAIVIRFQERPEKKDPQEADPDVVAWATEARTPPETLYNTRDARGAWRSRPSGKSLGESSYIEFVLESKTPVLPLGWMLSAQSARAISRYLSEDTKQPLRDVCRALGKTQEECEKQTP